MLIKTLIAAAALAFPAGLYAGQAPAKDWTIMVFLNGKNNLEGAALKDMNEMEAVGSSDRVNIVTELGRMAGYSSADGDWKGARRYLVKKDADGKKISSPILWSQEKTDMGDYTHLAEFGKWAKAAYPAKKYMLIVWNHGKGWEKYDGSGAKGISDDYETGNHITTQQLALALQEMGGADLYASDACLMQMAEVAYEIKDHAGYILGSEETEPADGYSYDKFLAALSAAPELAPEQLGRAVVDSFYEHYQGSDERYYTQSLLKASALPGLVKAADGFAAALVSAGERDVIKGAIYDAQWFAAPDSKDLWHFAGLVSARTKSPAVAAAGRALQDYITKDLVVYTRNSIHSGDSRGIAVFIPSAYNYAYERLAWAHASGWDEFLYWYSRQPLTLSL